MIHRLLLALLLTAATGPAFADTLQRGVALGDTVTVHATPDGDALAIRTLADGDAVLVLEQSATRAWLGAEKDFWYRIDDGHGGDGWVHGSQLLRSDLEAQVSASGVRMRDAPGTHGGFVRSLSGGAWVSVLDRSPEPETIGERTARWYQVRAGTATGWVYGAYLQLALTAPSSAHAPFLGWRCWPGKPGQPRPTEAQILVGLTRWRAAVDADISRRLASGDSDDASDATKALALGWEALRADDATEAIRLLAPLMQVAEDMATPLGSAQAAAAVFYADAVARGTASAGDALPAIEQALATGRGKILTGTDWSAPADLAALDRGLFLLEQELKDARMARTWAERLATDPAQSPLVRAAAGVASARLHFAARREAAAITAARRVFTLSADAQVTCGSIPVHFGATALTLVCDQLAAVGGAEEAAAICESLSRSGDPTLQAVARARLARLRDIGTADMEAVIAAYESVPDFRVRLADLRTLDGGDSAARAQSLRALSERVGASDEAWVSGDRVRLRAAPSRRGAVLAALSRDTVVRLLYRRPAWAAQDELAWIKVRVRGGQTGWMVEDYLELKAPRIAALPQATGMLWSQPGGTPDGRATAPGAEIDEPVVLWQIPDVLSGGPALGDANGDGTADLIVTGVAGDRACPRGVAVLDGRTQGEFWRAQTAGCTSGRSVAVDGDLVFAVSDARTLEAFDLRTGDLAWTWQAAAGAKITAPVAASDMVAIGATDGSVTVLEARSGQQWLRARLGAEVTVPPAIVGDVLYAVNERYVSAVDLRSQRPLWRARLMRHPARATAAGRAAGGLAVQGDMLFAASPGGILVACHRTRGDSRWQLDLGGTPVGGPVADGHRVIVALANGDVSAWLAEDGSPDWRVSAPGPIASRMLVADHTLVVGSSDGSLSGLSRVDGRLRWRLPLGAPLDRGPAGGGGRVVIGSSRGPLFVVGDASAPAAIAAPLRSGVSGSPRNY